MRVLCLLLAGAITFKLCFAQGINDNACKQYLSNVAELMLEKFVSYELSNLPDVDVEIEYNVTDDYSYDIKGTLYLEDGFVMDIGNIDCLPRSKYKCVIYKKLATIFSQISFAGVTFFRDFRFVAKNPENISDQALGGVVIKPDLFYFDFSVTHDLINDNITSEMGKMLQGQVHRKALDFEPKNTLTNRLKKSRTYTTNVFSELETKWQPIMQTFLDEITHTIPFPPVDFSTSRS